MVQLRMTKSCKGMQKRSATALLFPLLEIPAVDGMNWLTGTVVKSGVWSGESLGESAGGVASGVGGARRHLWWEFSRDASSGSHLGGGGFSLQVCHMIMYLKYDFDGLFFFPLSGNDYLYVPCFTQFVYFCWIHTGSQNYYNYEFPTSKNHHIFVKLIITSWKFGNSSGFNS